MNDADDQIKGSATVREFFTRIIAGMAEKEVTSATLDFDIPIAGKLMHAEFELTITDIREAE